MYDELIIRLHDAAKVSAALAVILPQSDGNAMVKLLDDAADAIEELSKRAFHLAPIDQYNGLKRKYIVVKADTGEDVPDCFVLRPAKDYAAVEALRAYARATDNKTLADDIYRWVGPLPEPPKEET